MKTSIHSLVPVTGTDWKPFTGDGLPESAMKWCRDGDVFRSGYGRVQLDATFYKGETPETATDWVMVTDDGGYYKVGAMFTVWRTLAPHGIVAHCNWSLSALRRNLLSILTTGKHLMDPDYQT